MLNNNTSLINKFDIKKKSIAISFVAATLFFFYNTYLINNGHFHEDAYILFVYVENLINGYGITYYPGASPLEGATDFLWLILLAGLASVGLDVGTASISLNSLGVWIIIFILSNTLLNNPPKEKWKIALLVPLLCLWLGQHYLLAAVGGFSIMLYMALALSALLCLLHKPYLTLLPFVAIVIALFRPDGVILGIGYTAVGLYFAHQQQILPKFLKRVAIAAMIGLVYFAWRFYYFDNLLPLPLYVKSHVEPLAGLALNISWLEKNLAILIPLLVFTILTKKLPAYLLYSVPALILLAALTTAENSQNVGFRYQGPVFITLYFLFFLATLDFFKKNRLILFSSLLIVVSILAFSKRAIENIDRTHESITHFNYINQFPAKFGQILPENSHIVLSEAGRTAYWNQREGTTITDLVGLNSVYPAKNIIDIPYIESLDADFLMFHHALRLDISNLPTDSGLKVIRLPSPSMLQPKATNETDFHSISKVYTASIMSIKFLNQHFFDYDIFAVDYMEDQSFSHVYAVKKELNLSEKLQSYLEESFNPKTKLSYYQMMEEYK